MQTYPESWQFKPLACINVKELTLSKIHIDLGQSDMYVEVQINSKCNRDH